MKHALGVALLTGFALCAANQPSSVCAETDQIDLKALAKKARPAVMLLVVTDAAGKEIATGTGFLVSADGKLITNFHVIEKAASVIAKAENGGKFEVEGVLAADPKNDLVLLKIKGKDLPFLTLGKSENIEVGTRIAVIGSPLGLEGTLSEGIVSAVRELMGNTKLLQVTAAISPGSSGSPVLNSKGEVVGVAVAQLRGGQLLNLAIPSSQASQTLMRAAVKASPFGRQAQGEALLGLRDRKNRSQVRSDPDFQACLDSVEIERDLPKALTLAKKLAAKYPSDSDARALLSTVFDAMGFEEDALTTAKEAAELDPSNAWAWFRIGQSSKGKERINALRQAIKINPRYGEAWASLALTHHEAGQHGEAALAFEQALEAFTRGNFLPLFMRENEALYSLVAGNFLDRAHSALLRDPDDLAAWMKYSTVADSLWARTSKELCQKLDTFYPKLIDAHPDNHSLWGQYEEAVKSGHSLSDLMNFCIKHISQSPTNTAAWMTLDSAIQKQGTNDLSGIIEFCKTQIASSPNSHAWHTICQAYVQQGQTNSFVSLCEQYSSNQMAHVVLGRTYRESGDITKACAAFEKATQLTGDAAGFAWRSLVELYDQQGKYDRARAAYIALIKINPKFPETQKKRLSYKREANQASERLHEQLVGSKDTYIPRYCEEEVRKEREAEKIWSKYLPAAR